MSEEYSFEINKKAYLLKRMFHCDLPLTYHIHCFSGNKNAILRMGMIEGKWGFLNTMHLHFKFGDLEFHLATEIGDNEKRISALRENAPARYTIPKQNRF